MVGICSSMSSTLAPENILDKDSYQPMISTNSHIGQVSDVWTFCSGVSSSLLLPPAGHLLWCTKAWADIYCPKMFLTWIIINLAMRWWYTSDIKQVSGVWTLCELIFVAAARGSFSLMDRLQLWDRRGDKRGNLRRHLWSNIFLTPSSNFLEPISLTPSSNILDYRKLFEFLPQYSNIFWMRGSFWRNLLTYKTQQFGGSNQINQKPARKFGCWIRGWSIVCQIAKPVPD